MATPFDTIFKQFLLIIDDPKFINNFTEDCLAETLSDYLDRARGIFGDYCYKDLNNYVATSHDVNNFVGDAVTTQFPLSSTPVDGSEFYVSVNDIKTTNYIYSSALNSIITSSTPILDSNIYIGVYKTGLFNDNLNVQEITYLARGMTIPYLEFQLQKQKHLNQIVYGKDYEIHSQANHIQQDRETVDDVEQRLIRDMVMYTYRQSPDELQGSSGYKYL